MQVTSWNIAAINNNPWEYWITYNNENYIKLMEGIEEFIENPKEKDISVSSIFTDEMANELFNKMENENWNNIDKVKNHWNNNYKNRKIISEFLKDKSIGAKRLTSMPDRFTNTIQLADPPKKILCRPTIINCFNGDLSSISLWFNSWIKFIFEEKTNSKSKDGKSIISKRICDLFPKILKAKYPAITEEEEEISIPLQVLCLGIFDCILVHMMNIVSGKNWIDIKSELCDKLNNQKISRTCEIIDSKYVNSSIIALQECGAIFLDEISNFGKIGDEFTTHYPKNMDKSRDQNSVILLKKNYFNSNSVNEITNEVIEELTKNEKKSPIVNGDLFVISVSLKENENEKFLISSFHGDTNGLATIPVLQALYNVYTSKYSNDHSFIFCLDANTYENPTSSQQGVTDFANFFTEKCNLTSCFGDNPNPSNYTTFNARTYLQPQLNKACKSSEKRKGDVNPKDFILFSKNQYEVTKWTKDNTGNVEYIEDIVFPTLTFPSDHGILSCSIKSTKSSNL